MKIKVLLFLVFSTFIITTACMQVDQSRIQYPSAKKVDTVDVYFGQKVADPYRWLEDDNSPETEAWVKAENKVTFEYLSKIPFREKLKKHLTQIWNYPKYRVPFKKGDRYFMYKNNGIQDQDVLYVKDGADGEMEVLLDPNTLSDDGTIALTDISVSRNGKYLAYSISSGGSDWNEIFILEIDTKKLLDDHIRWVKFSGISWKGDGFFYSAYDEPDEDDVLSGQNRFHKVFYHRLNTSQKDDLLVYDNPDKPLRNYYGFTTPDEQFVAIVETESTSGNALYVARADDVSKLKFKKIADGFDYDYTLIGHAGDDLIVQTNDNAPKGKVVKIAFAEPARENWTDLIPEGDYVLEVTAIANRKIYTQYLKDASNRASFYSMDGEFLKELELPGIGTITEFKGEEDDPVAFYGFTSFTAPLNIYEYDVDAGTAKLFKKTEVNFDSEGYETKQLFFKSKDGTEIPMFIVSKKGLELNGNNPVLMYGYGGFNISLTPGFSISRMAFLEQGGVYVMVNLRGGGEYGEAWHKAGMKMNKQNVFDDFISAAKYLIDNKYTNSDRLAIMGGSNGGLLVGACMTQKPGLFKVAIPMVGVMDMLRYHRFTIGWAWATDYGRSDESEEMFRYLLSYSPLHNIKKGVDYPATLAITADHDDRVVPAHTFKFMATLQEKNSGKNPVLVRIETRAGHGAGKPTSKQIEEATDIYSFIMYNLGMSPAF